METIYTSTNRRLKKLFVIHLMDCTASVKGNVVSPRAQESVALLLH